MKKVLLLTLSLLTAALAVSQNRPSAVNLVCGPYLQNVTANSFTVVFVSDIDALVWVELAPDDGTHFYREERPKYYDLTGYGVNPIGKIHRVTVDGLQPDTRYRYRVMMKGVKTFESERDIEYTKPYGANVYSARPPVVKTLKTEYDEVNFSVTNDIHEHTEVLEQLYKDARGRNYDFVLYNGDMTTTLNDHTKIMSCYMTSTTKLFADEVPFYCVRGNHEFRGKDSVRWLDYFVSPGGKPYYYFSYGKFFFLVLDGAEDKPDSDIEYQGVLATAPFVARETEWLKEVVKTPEFRNSEVRIVFCHIPPVDAGAPYLAWYGDSMVNDCFVPILNEAGVDVMFCADKHLYYLSPAGSGDAKFPVLVNANEERMDVTATADKISVKIYDKDGKQTHANEFKTKLWK